MKKYFQKFRRGQDGVAFLEFAITLPFLLALFIGAVDVTRYIIIVQKLDKATTTMSDVVAQSSTISTAELDQLVLAVQQIVLPYTFSTNGYVVITSVTKTGATPPSVSWQYAGGGSWVHTSLVGTPGGAANWLPFVAPYNTMDANENIIITEVWYNYVPLFTNSVIPSVPISKVAVFKPRLGTLGTLL